MGWMVDPCMGLHSPLFWQMPMGRSRGPGPMVGRPSSSKEGWVSTLNFFILGLPNCKTGISAHLRLHEILKQGSGMWLLIRPFLSSE